MSISLRLCALVSLVFACACPGVAASAAAAGEFEQLSAKVIRALKAGDHASAERLVEAAFGLAQNFDSHDARRVNIRLLRGEVARHSGQSDLAETWYRDAVSAAATAFGEQSPQLVWPLEALANLYSLTGKRDRAVAVETRLLAIAEKVRPADPLDIARRCRNLAEAHVAAGQPSAAEPFYRRAVQTAESFPAGLEADQAEYLRALAEYLLHQQRLAEARALSERAVALASQSLGPNDLGLCVPLETAGDIRLAEREPAAAAVLFERSLRIMERVVGADNADLARPLVRLAAAERARGNRTQAEALCVRATAVVTRGLGADVPELSPVLDEQASLLEDLHRVDDAAVLRHRAAELRKRAAG
jgi:tetratricopeptide (TPR) repeat protein